MSDRSKDIDEKLLWIGLGSISGIGSQTYCQLLKAFGSPASIFAASAKQLKGIVSANIASEIMRGFDPETLAQTRQWLLQENNHLVTLADPEYPKSLLEIADPPPFLYAKGNLDLLNQPGIAIVGSRNASVQGEKNAEAFAYELSTYGLCIVSGLALGFLGLALYLPWLARLFRFGDLPGVFLLLALALGLLSVIWFEAVKRARRQRPVQRA